MKVNKINFMISQKIILATDPLNEFQIVFVI